MLMHLNLGKPKSLASKFGFLKNSAKSVMRSVFTAVVGGEAKATRKSSVKASATRQSNADSGTRTTTSSKSVAVNDPPSINASERHKVTGYPGGFRPTTSKASATMEAPVISSRPAFLATSPPAQSTPTSTTVMGQSISSRGSMALSTIRSSRTPSLSSTARSSTVYSRSSGLSGTTRGTVSSIGLLRKPSVAKSETTTLYAPTVSSLAKCRAPQNGSISGNTKHMNASSTRTGDWVTRGSNTAPSRGMSSKFGFVGNPTPAKIPSTLVASPLEQASLSNSTLSSAPSKLPISQGFKFKATDFADPKSPPTPCRTSTKSEIGRAHV